MLGNKTHHDAIMMMQPRLTRGSWRCKSRQMLTGQCWGSCKLCNNITSNAASDILT